MKVLSLGSNARWTTVAIPGALAGNDSEFQFLSGFEEIDPASLADVSASNAATSETITAVEKTTKKKAKRKRKLQDNAGTKTEQKSENSDTAVVEIETELVAETETEKANSATALEAWQELYVPTAVLQALEEMKFTEPTEIQRRVLVPAIRDRLDIFGAAETGSGKTLAFAIPMIARLLETDEWNAPLTSAEEEASVPIEKRTNSLRALILTPTRELAKQVRDHVAAVIKHTRLTCTCFIGGMSVEKQKRLARRRPEIAIATPGRLWAVYNQEETLSDYFNDFEDVECLVVDEADRMVEKNHYEELIHILTQINGCTKASKRQTLVFSATLTYVHPNPKRSAKKIKRTDEGQKDKTEMIIAAVGLKKQRKVIDLTRSFGTAESLTESRINCADLIDKDCLLYYFLWRYPGRTLIFANSIDASRRLHGLLTKLSPDAQPIHRPLLLHAKMQQKQRLKSLERFAEQSKSVLIATDVAARGLDIKGIENVIHYQIPKTAELYVHRSGRTARATREGLSVMLVDPTEAQFYRRVCANLNRDKDLPIFPIDNPKLAQQLRARVKVVAELDSVEHRIRKKAARGNWFQKQALEADLEFDHLDNEQSSLDDEIATLKQKQVQLQSQLRSLLSQPLGDTGGGLMKPTRYPTFDIVSAYNKASSSAAVAASDGDTALSSAKSSAGQQTTASANIRLVGTSTMPIGSSDFRPSGAAGEIEQRAKNFGTKESGEKEKGKATLI